MALMAVIVGSWDQAARKCKDPQKADAREVCLGSCLAALSLSLLLGPALQLDPHLTAHSPDVKQEAWVASERAKREAWMAEQTRAIKESTVRGLEPEIQASAGRRQSAAMHSTGSSWLDGAAAEEALLRRPAAS